jgi:hypothetical protein
MHSHIDLSEEVENVCAEREQCYEYRAGRIWLLRRLHDHFACLVAERRKVVKTLYHFSVSSLPGGHRVFERKFASDCLRIAVENIPAQCMESMSASPRSIAYVTTGT